MASLDTIFKAYDVRGTVPDQFDTDVARAVGAAFARFTGAPRILVGWDMRPTGRELVDAFTEGATSQGTDVTHLGMVSTDCIQRVYCHACRVPKESCRREDSRCTHFPRTIRAISNTIRSRRPRERCHSERCPPGSSLHC